LSFFIFNIQLHSCYLVLVSVTELQSTGKRGGVEWGVDDEGMDGVSGLTGSTDWDTPWLRAGSGLDDTSHTDTMKRAHMINSGGQPRRQIDV